MNHLPVLATEALSFLDLSHRSTIVDATLGLGGHSECILNDSSFHGKIIGIDQDQQHLDFARERLKKFSDHLIFIKGNFADLKSLRSEQGESFDGILFDLGIASPHIDDPNRGFSFQADGPLDMRMDKTQKLTAEKVVNSSSENELMNIFRDFGEERLAKRIARKIVEQRKIKSFRTTQELSKLIDNVYQHSVFHHSRIHPATRIFQALRIAVNDELEALAKGLADAVEMTQPGGRILVISYHSLEDRIVKNLFRQAEKPCTCPPKVPHCICGKEPTLRIITKKPITPSKEEIRENPRARSAKMRVAEKV